LQHELSAPIAGEPQAFAMARQQAGCPIGRNASRQADAGRAVQKTTTANINNTPFLSQFMVYKSQPLTLSIRY